MDFEDLFDEDVVNRGYGYFMEGRVMNFKMTDKLITAQVLGTHKYDVEIHISHNHIVDMECNCYYGDKCKHMAAVLSYFDEHYSGNITLDSELNKYKKEIDHTIQYFSDRDGFISFHQARNFIGNIQNIISYDVGTLMDNRDYLEAFELTAYIFDRIYNVDMDDSVGGKIEIAEECVSIWKEIIDAADERTKDKMYQWLENYIETSCSDFNGYVEEILDEYFW
ncbi:MAG: hypothetical protein LUH02_03280 [Erysipelotrichaceae bacterium]|nr:hypothetical protein [Erysipelotrichaceae bacterium]